MWTKDCLLCHKPANHYIEVLEVIGAMESRKAICMDCIEVLKEVIAKATNP